MLTFTCSIHLPYSASSHSNLHLTTVESTLPLLSAIVTLSFRYLPFLSFSSLGNVA